MGEGGACALRGDWTDVDKVQVLSRRDFGFFVLSLPTVSMSCTTRTKECD